MVRLKALILGAFAALAQAGPPYCLPGNPCFPSDTELAAFNRSVSGQLIKSEPYGKACYGKLYNGAACKTLAKQNGDFNYRLNLPAGAMFTNWEQDGKLGCPVPPLGPDGKCPPAVDDECTLGGMPSYVVKATSDWDVATAVYFAAKWNLRLRVKSTGHDYSGRSSGAGALSIWTANMKDMTVFPLFRPQCDMSRPPVPAILAGVGVTVGELNDFAGKKGYVAMGGYSPTVGASGGFILGGGIGPLGNTLGMGVDNVAQFDVITADGKKKIANPCSNPDLFWALRGGGSAFGVVVRVYFKVYPEFKAVNTISGAITCENSNAYKELVNRMVDLQVPLRNANISGIRTSQGSPNNVLTLFLLRPYSKQDTKVRYPGDELKILDSLLKIKGCKNAVQPTQFPSFLKAYDTVIGPAIQKGAPIGINLKLASRLISQNIMKDNKKLQRVKDYITDLPGTEGFIWQNSALKRKDEDTSVNPEWNDAFASMDTSVVGPWSGVTPAEDATFAAVQANMTSVFGTAAYYNENSVDDKEFWKASWGANYERLMQIKQKWDPKRIFNCRGCVGSEAGF